MHLYLYEFSEKSFLYYTA